MTVPAVTVDRLRPADLDQVLAIERTVFADPWSRVSFEYELRDSSISYLLAARAGTELLGYLVAWFVEDEMHLGNLAVSPGWQGQGIGRTLVAHLLAEAARRRCVRATLEVRVSNRRAIALYEREGFRPVALRRRYYRDNGEDAVIMLADLGSAGAGAEPPPGPASGRQPAGGEAS